MLINFPNTVVSVTDRALVIHHEKPMATISSAVIGGGMGFVRFIVNFHVEHGYSCEQPEKDLETFARDLGINEPFVGMMTAVPINKVQYSTLRENGVTAAALVTAGLSNLSAAGLTPPAQLKVGTINMVLLLDAALTPAAMVNAVTTATEAKTAVLYELGKKTKEDYPATGTSTDAIALGCSGRGELHKYAGPATNIGWLVGQCVHGALHKALVNP